ncbi:MAG TPA: c-type cytochrome biogenesis protein CcsB [Dissulfurispiraceae bacterium]|nr:c-type cytochrome biogenesis protein CcsB [Dissulfurispiraceae bacterium]
MGTILFELALTGYFVAVIIGIVDLFKGGKESSRLMISISAAGFILHTASILYRSFAGGHLPVASMHEAASFFAWCVVLIYFSLEYRYKIGIMGSFILPLVLMLMLTSAFLPRAIVPLSPVLRSHWLWIHTIFAFVSNAAFAVAFGVGTMYLMQEYYLKSKHLSGLFKRLPSLQVLDEINHKLINTGFPFLTMAIISGSLWAESAWGRFWSWDPKEVWSLITWLIYAVILHLRLTAGWRKKRAAILSVIGFIAVMFTFLGVNFLLKSAHTFQ